MPRPIVDSIQDIWLATSHPTDWNRLTVSVHAHFFEASNDFFNMHLPTLRNAVAWLGCRELRGKVTWARLSNFEKGVIQKFIRLIQGQSHLVWFSTIPLKGGFWKEAIKESSSWMPCILEVNPHEPVKKLGLKPLSEKNHQLSYHCLGHSTLFIHYELADGKSWNCVINPHEAATITLSEGGLYSRACPPLHYKEQLPPIDAVVVTDSREDLYDLQALTFFQIYQPTFFLSGDLKGSGFASVVQFGKSQRFMMMENTSSAKLVITYFPPQCPKDGNKHSGSLVFSFPSTTAMDTFTDVVVLGTGECCSEEDYLAHCKKIKGVFSLCAVAFVPIDSLLVRKDYISMMARAIQILEPKSYVGMHFGIWPFHIDQESPADRLARELGHV